MNALWADLKQRAVAFTDVTVEGGAILPTEAPPAYERGCM